MGRPRSVISDVRSFFTEELDDKHLQKIKRCYEEIATKSRAAMKKGTKDTGTPFVHFDDDEAEPPARKPERARGVS